MERTVILCTDCGTAFTGRVGEDGRIVLSTEEGACSECGGSAFAEAEDGIIGDD